jgi:single-stranded-DNA-specific exonuclease
LGTIADCVTLDFNNRILVSKGLEIMRAGKARAGIKALLKLAKRSPMLLESDDMGFAVAPRLNAAGRLEDMSIGVKCLLAQSDHDAMFLAQQLDGINNLRRSMQKEMIDEALSYVEKLSLLDYSIMIVYQQSWHEGIIGLVASMLKEKFHLPSIALTKDDSGVLKGSCRSIPGLNIRDLLVEYDRTSPNDLLKFGGHAMAAGFSLKKESLDSFTSKMSKLASISVDEKMRQKDLWVDGSLPSDHRTIQFAKTLMKSGPWGNGFEKPLFYDEFEICEQYRVGGSHLKLVLSDQSKVYQAIWFNVENDWPKHDCQRASVVYHLQINEFNQRRQLQLLIVAIIPI